VIYVCPRYDNWPKAMQSRHRLYAFPGSPDPPPPDGFVILDSGAFGLYQRSAAIDVRHMWRLADHYRPYAGQPGYHCIAPDVFLDPGQTMRNWRWWQDNIGLPVVPVIQFRRMRRLDLFTVYKQALFYAPWQPSFVAISNPGLRAIESATIKHACQIVREITGAQWLHNLGAGWDPRDIAAWHDLGCFDSIDSIAYYTDAHNGWRWQRGGGRVLDPDADWRRLAASNAAAAAEIASRRAL